MDENFVRAALFFCELLKFGIHNLLINGENYSSKSFRIVALS